MFGGSFAEGLHHFVEACHKFRGSSIEQKERRLACFRVALSQRCSVLFWRARRTVDSFAIAPPERLLKRRTTRMTT
jgi:hypothetical protein